MARINSRLIPIWKKKEAIRQRAWRALKYSTWLSAAQPHPTPQPSASNEQLHIHQQLPDGSHDTVKQHCMSGGGQSRQCDVSSKSTSSLARCVLRRKRRHLPAECFCFVILPGVCVAAAQLTCRLCTNSSLLELSSGWERCGNGPAQPCCPFTSKEPDLRHKLSYRIR